MECRLFALASRHYNNNNNITCMSVQTGWRADGQKGRLAKWWRINVAAAVRVLRVSRTYVQISYKGFKPKQSKHNGSCRYVCYSDFCGNLIAFYSGSIYTAFSCILYYSTNSDDTLSRRNCEIQSRELRRKEHHPAIFFFKQ